MAAAGSVRRRRSRRTTRWPPSTGSAARADPRPAPPGRGCAAPRPGFGVHFLRRPRGPGRRAALGRSTPGPARPLHLGIAFQLAAFLRDLGLHLLGLRPDRGVLAQPHRDRAGDHAGDAGQHDRPRRDPAAADAGDERDVGDQPVHGTEHRRPQPAAGDIGVMVLGARRLPIRAASGCRSRSRSPPRCARTGRSTRRSFVSTVQPSRHMSCRYVPRVIIGSMVNVMPGSMTTVRLGLS